MALWLLWSAEPVLAQTVTVSGSATYSQGKYIFAEAYESWAWLGSLSVDWRRATLSVSVPLVAQNGTVLSRVAGAAIPTGGPESGVVQRRQGGEPVRVRSGRRIGGSGSASSVAMSVAMEDPVDPSIASRRQSAPTDTAMVSGPGSFDVNIADPLFGGSVTALESADRRQSLSLEAWVKAPMAPTSSGVSTGAWDYAVGATTGLSNGRLHVSSSATWWVLGDLPDLPLRDALFYSVGLGASIGSRWGTQASLSGATRVIEQTEPPVSAAVALYHHSARSSVGINVGVGLTESAAAYTLGLSVSARARRSTDR